MSVPTIPGAWRRHYNDQGHLIQWTEAITGLGLRSNFGALFGFGGPRRFAARLSQPNAGPSPVFIDEFNASRLQSIPYFIARFAATAEPSVVGL